MFLSSQIIVANNEQKVSNISNTKNINNTKNNTSTEKKENKENIKSNDVNIETKESKENEMKTNNVTEYEVFDFIATKCGKLASGFSSRLTQKEREILHEILTESLITFSQFSTLRSSHSIADLSHLMVEEEAKKIIYLHLQTENIHHLWFSKLVTLGLDNLQCRWAHWNENFDRENHEQYPDLTSLGFSKTYDKLKKLK